MAILLPHLKNKVIKVVEFENIIGKFTSVKAKGTSFFLVSDSSRAHQGTVKRYHNLFYF